MLLPGVIPEDIVVLPVPTPFPVGDVNCYLIRGDVPTLVDTGPATDEARVRLEEGIRQAGLGLRDIRQVIVTHAHVDHHGQAGALREAGLAVLAHPHARGPLADADAYRAFRHDFFVRFYQEAGLGAGAVGLASRFDVMSRRWIRPGAVDREIDDGTEIVAGSDTWQVLYLPGHSPSQIGLYRARDGVLIAGDHLLAHISSNAFIEPVPGAPERPRSLITYRLALMRLLTLDINMVLPGHGRPVTDHRSLVERRLRFHEERAGSILRHLQAGPATSLELAQKLFLHLKPDALALAISEVVGHLDLLVERGLVRTRQAGGVIEYHAAGSGRGGMPGDTEHNAAAC